MKLRYLPLVLSLALVPSAFAKEKVSDEAHDSYEETTSHNPITGTTTKKAVRKGKHGYKRDGQDYNSEETVKVKKKTSDDGHKTVIHKEETILEEKSK